MRQPYGCGAAAVGAYLYAFGGEGLSVVQPGCMTMYNMATRKMAELAKLPRTLIYCPGVACGGLVYSLGGYDEELQTSVAGVHTYNPDIDSWVGGPTLPMAMAGVAAAEHMGCIFVCSGWLGRAAPLSGSLLMLDPRTRAWTSLPTMPTTGGSVLAGRMSVPGGGRGEVLPCSAM